MEAVHAEIYQSAVVQSTGVGAEGSSSQGIFSLSQRASSTDTSETEREGMCGHWLTESRTHVYIRI